MIKTALLSASLPMVRWRHKRRPDLHAKIFLGVEHDHEPLHGPAAHDNPHIHPLGVTHVDSTTEA